MAPLNEQQLTRIRDERRTQIKQAALAVFSRRGLAGARMSQVATEAKVSHGLLYRYFESKEDLFGELVRDLLEEASSELGQLEHLPGTPAQQLEGLTASMLDESHRAAFRLIHHARTTPGMPRDLKRALEGSSPSALIESLVPLFRRGQRSGELVSGDPRQLLSWYFDVVNSLVLGDPLLPEHGLPGAGMLMRMLRAPPGRAEREVRA